MNFAVIGVGGYIAPRHLEAIKELGHNLVAAYDHNDSVGIMDRFFPDCQFFTDFERFESFVDLKKGSSEQIDYVSICTPNYMHSSHIKFALSHGAHAICEKPLVLYEKEIDELEHYENKFGKNVYTVLQLRVHDAILALKSKVNSEKKAMYDIDLNYMTSRGQWYHESWKGDVRKSGGLSTNIGVHFFDMLTWIFGEAEEVTVFEKSSTAEKGALKLKNARVIWSLTIDRSKLPPDALKAGKTTFRSIKIDGSEFEFSEGFTELHKRVYTDILNGKGYGLNAARAAIRIVEQIRGM
ncbi:UDP-N-acetyl-2-amino-2-deoxy-D-glucuronate oxidase [Bdellovibrio bacteriovorus]|uniref:Gfo/Idh/MocA family oxidoreductase n=1 Tax=Bdellovibrio bacteriovorus TaxID=959 RepID=UPI00045C0EA4|nr:Gfo/Idh/MocA family oxidoreductase [Bdellovibrio bacteriovorus]AHZ84213.1 oxidoreductase [Bdellovibrio bacteriovorus]BEV68098.1 UDP-N-acetyl-2-amino-2-deoxy-D-glucuronate oxidase [Bdellovibrio bacteriovorus]